MRALVRAWIGKGAAQKLPLLETISVCLHNIVVERQLEVSYFFWVIYFQLYFEHFGLEVTSTFVL